MPFNIKKVRQNKSTRSCESGSARGLVMWGLLIARHLTIVAGKLSTNTQVNQEHASTNQSQLSICSQDCTSCNTRECY